MSKFIKTFIFGLILLIGIGIFTNSAKAGDGLNLELVSPPWDIIYGGETKTVELKIINNTGYLLDGEATFSTWYGGEPFQGNLIAISPSFGLSDNRSDWIEGSVIFSDFEIPEGEISTTLKIETHPALIPGQYSFTFSLKGTAEEEYVAPPVVIGGGGYYTPPTGYETGDTNKDGKVDKYDFLLMMANWGGTGTNDSDLNNDNKVDKYDFALLMLNWSTI